MRLFRLLLVATPALLSAQAASLTYLLGKDTLAIEQYTRTPTGITGEMVSRQGAAVVRAAYAMTLGKDGRPTSASLKRMQADGTPTSPTAATEFRLTFTADSVVFEAIVAAGPQARSFAVKGALVNWPVFIYGPTEVLAALRKNASVDSVPAIAVTGQLGYTGITALGGDMMRLKGGPYAMVLTFDANNRLQSLDGSNTTNKVMAKRGSGGLDIAAIAKAMKPTGVLSAREDARAAFGPGGFVVVDYSRPSVRERTVWGGTLVPFDSVWRAGANDATHLFTTRTLTFGGITLAPGMYTLWVQHTKTATYLIFNKQTGQWGTQYDAAQDIGRVEMQSAAAPSFVETMMITIGNTGPNRGLLNIAWGDKVMSAPFTVSAAR